MGAIMKTGTKKVFFAFAAALASAAVIGLFVSLPLSVYGPLTGKPHAHASGHPEAGAQEMTRRTSDAAPAGALSEHTILVFVISGWAAVGLIVLIGSLLLRDRHDDSLKARPMPGLSGAKHTDEMVVGVVPTQSGATRETYLGIERRLRAEGRRAADRIVSARVRAEGRRASDRMAPARMLATG